MTSTLSFTFNKAGPSLFKIEILLGETVYFPYEACSIRHSVDSSFLKDFLWVDLDRNPVQMKNSRVITRQSHHLTREGYNDDVIANITTFLEHEEDPI